LAQKKPVSENPRRVASAVRITALRFVVMRDHLNPNTYIKLTDEKETAPYRAEYLRLVALVSCRALKFRPTTGQQEECQNDSMRRPSARI
jgi:hypothetical protein